MLAALPPARAAVARRDIRPNVYRTLQLDLDAMKTRLAAAPPEFLGPIESVGVEITLPLPYGGFGRFLVLNSPIMEKGLADKYPMIQTYVAQGIDDPAATARLDVTTRGFRAMVLSPRGQFCIDPYWRDEDRTYLAYYKRNLQPVHSFRCEVHGGDKAAVDGVKLPRPPRALRPTGAQLRTYQMAVSTNGEYSEAVCNPSAPNLPGTLSAITTSVNRVSLIFERDLAIRLRLVNNTDAAVFLDRNTDPYSGDNNALLSQVTAQIPALIGNANYDVGHLFASYGNGGVAGFGVVCSGTNAKASGVTNSGNPTQDPFDIDFLAHELGHQFGAEHTFNSDGACLDNRNAATAYEPGSGSTIMSYAGVCPGRDLAGHSDGYFHGATYEEIDDFTAGAGHAHLGRHRFLPEYHGARLQWHRSGLGPVLHPQCPHARGQLPRRLRPGRRQCRLHGRSER